MTVEEARTVVLSLPPQEQAGRTHRAFDASFGRRLAGADERLRHAASTDSSKHAVTQSEDTAEVRPPQVPPSAYTPPS